MNISDYNNFSVNEVHAMFENKQLDMLVKDEKNNKKVYVKYHLGKTLRRENMNDYIDDLFNKSCFFIYNKRWFFRNNIYSFNTFF